MQTNIEISSNTIPSLLGYRDALKTIKTYQLKGEDATLSDGGSYQIVTSDHLLETQNRIRGELGLRKVTQLKTSATVYENLYGSSKASLLIIAMIFQGKAHPILIVTAILLTQVEVRRVQPIREILVLKTLQHQVVYP